MLTIVASVCCFNVGLGEAGADVFFCEFSVFYLYYSTGAAGHRI